MKKNIILLVNILIGLMFISSCSEYSTDANQQLANVREELRPKIDSIQQTIWHRQELHDKINASIASGDYKQADSLINHLTDKQFVHTYKGMLLCKQKKYLEASEEYNLALEIRRTPNTLEKRGDLYIETKKLDLALKDYLEAYEGNEDFAYDVGEVFDLMSQKDSALKYYIIYLNDYPEDDSVKAKIKILRERK